MHGEDSAQAHDLCCTLSSRDVMHIHKRDCQRLRPIIRDARPVERAPPRCRILFAAPHAPALDIRVLK